MLTLKFTNFVSPPLNASLPILGSLTHGLQVGGGGNPGSHRGWSIEPSGAMHWVFVESQGGRGRCLRAFIYVRE